MIVVSSFRTILSLMHCHLSVTYIEANFQDFFLSLHACVTFLAPLSEIRLCLSF